MRFPNFQELRRDRERFRYAGGPCPNRSYASGVHPNPRVFKYYWWVFWNASLADGRDLLVERHRLATAAAVGLMGHLHAIKEPIWVYNERHPRGGLQALFDRHSAAWNRAEWAPSYDEDPDPVTDGALLGHK